MSDPVDPTPAPSLSVPGLAQEVEVDLAAFLPEGVELGEETVDDEGAAIDPEPAAPVGPERQAVDLEALSQIERDLDAVDAAIIALDAGTYGTDPATGQPLDDALLAQDPTRLS